jgi:hypothetical protein
MRTEVIRCDVCGKVHDVQYWIPADWIEIRQSDGYGNDESKHFCSTTCIRKWVDDKDAKRI